MVSPVETVAVFAEAYTCTHWYALEAHLYTLEANVVFLSARTNRDIVVLLSYSGVTPCLVQERDQCDAAAVGVADPPVGVAGAAGAAGGRRRAPRRRGAAADEGVDAAERDGPPHGHDRHGQAVLGRGRARPGDAAASGHRDLRAPHWCASHAAAVCMPLQVEHQLIYRSCSLARSWVVATFDRQI